MSHPDDLIEDLCEVWHECGPEADYGTKVRAILTAYDVHAQARIAELEARCAKMREAIENAPHEVFCKARLCLVCGCELSKCGPWYEPPHIVEPHESKPGMCNCWKRAAEGGEHG